MLRVWLSSDSTPTPMQAQIVCMLLVFEIQKRSQRLSRRSLLSRSTCWFPRQAMVSPLTDSRISAFAGFQWALRLLASLGVLSSAPPRALQLLVLLIPSTTEFHLLNWIRSSAIDIDDSVALQERLDRFSSRGRVKQKK